MARRTRIYTPTDAPAPGTPAAQAVESVTTPPFTEALGRVYRPGETPTVVIDSLEVLSDPARVDEAVQSALASKSTMVADLGKADEEAGTYTIDTLVGNPNSGVEDDAGAPVPTLVGDPEKEQEDDEAAKAALTVGSPDLEDEDDDEDDDEEDEDDDEEDLTPKKTSKKTPTKFVAPTLIRISDDELNAPRISTALRNQGGNSNFDTTVEWKALEPDQRRRALIASIVRKQHITARHLCVGYELGRREDEKQVPALRSPDPVACTLGADGIIKATDLSGYVILLDDMKDPQSFERWLQPVLARASDAIQEAKHSSPYAVYDLIIEGVHFVLPTTPAELPVNVIRTPGSNKSYERANAVSAAYPDYEALISLFEGAWIIATHYTKASFLTAVNELPADPNLVLRGWAESLTVEVDAALKKSVKELAIEQRKVLELQRRIGSLRFNIDMLTKSSKDALRATIDRLGESSLVESIKYTHGGVTLVTYPMYYAPPLTLPKSLRNLSGNPASRKFWEDPIYLGVYEMRLSMTSNDEAGGYSSRKSRNVRVAKYAVQARNIAAPWSDAQTCHGGDPKTGSAPCMGNFVAAIGMAFEGFDIYTAILTALEFIRAPNLDDSGAFNRLQAAANFQSLPEHRRKTHKHEKFFNLFNPGAYWDLGDLDGDDDE